MTAPTNHWKLGLFVVVGVLVGLAAVVYLGSRALPRESIAYTSYFDESITGLEIGSPVRYRGVAIGSVSGIAIAPDRRHVAVTYDLGVAVLVHLGLAPPADQGSKLYLSPDIRAQIASTGVTGIKFLELDFFAPRDYPVPKLSFKVAENYIPVAQSMFKNLEDSVVQAVDRFPEVADQIVELTTKINRMLDDLDQQQLPARVGVTLQNASTTFQNVDRVLASLERKVAEVDAEGVSSDARTTLKHVDETVAEMHAMITRVNGEQGLLMSAQRATDSVGDAVQNAGSLSTNLDDTMRDIREMSQSIRDLVGALELDSDMLLKGRAKAVSR